MNATKERVGHTPGEIRQHFPALGNFTEANANKCGGKLLLKGTRFSVAQLVAELADDGDSVRNVCDNYNLDRKQVVHVLHALASGLSEPVLYQRCRNCIDGVEYMQPFYDWGGHLARCQRPCRVCNGTMRVQTWPRIGSSSAGPGQGGETENRMSKLEELIAAYLRGEWPSVPLMNEARAEQSELVASLRLLMAADLDDRQRPTDEQWSKIDVLLSRFGKD